MDSSGFSTSHFKRWYDAKYGNERSERQWLKMHLLAGVTTNIVTSVKMAESASNDSPHLPALARMTAKRFDVDEVSDKGYVSNKNPETVVTLGAIPYIPFKVNINTTGEGPELWWQLYHYYQFNCEAFLTHYHKCSNVETTFSMI